MTARQVSGWKARFLGALGPLLRTTGPIVVLTLATRAIQGLSGPVSAVLIVRSFSPVEQGYYYTFVGLVAAFGFFELGLSTLLTAFSAHAWAKVQQSGPDSTPERAYLRTLFRKSVLWYAAIGLVAWPVIGLSGHALMDPAGHGQSVAHWVPAWALFSILSAITLVMTPLWAFLSGCGHYESVTRYRLIEVVVRNGVLWAALLGGAGLLACGLSALGVLLASLVFLFQRRDFVRQLLVPNGKGDSPGMHWRRDVLPMQWRLGVSWICGYLSIVLFAPFSFHVFGPQVAGQVGLTWALAAGLSMLSASWASAKAPQFANLVASGAFADLDQLVSITRRTAVFVSMALGLSALVAFLVLTSLWPALSGRFLPLPAVICFLLADPFMQVATVQSQTLRAFRHEAFLPASIAFALAILLSTPLTVSISGPIGVAWSYLLGVLAMYVVGRKIFNVHRAQWKAQIDRS